MYWFNGTKAKRKNTAINNEEITCNVCQKGNSFFKAGINPVKIIEIVESPINNVHFLSL